MQYKLLQFFGKPLYIQIFTTVWSKIEKIYGYNHQNYTVFRSSFKYEDKFRKSFYQHKRFSKKFINEIDLHITTMFYMTCLSNCTLKCLEVYMTSKTHYFIWNINFYSFQKMFMTAHSFSSNQFLSIQIRCWSRAFWERYHFLINTFMQWESKRKSVNVTVIKWPRWICLFLA